MPENPGTLDGVPLPQPEAAVTRLGRSSFRALIGISGHLELALLDISMSGWPPAQSTR